MSDDKPYLGSGDFCVDGGQHSSRVIGASTVNQKYVMKILPSSLAFAMTEVDYETAPSFLSVVNLGTKPITIYEITVVGDFNIMTSFVMGSTLLPNGSFDIAVKFAPKRTGAVTGGVYVRATESVGIEFAELTGTGNIADPSIPASLALQTLLESDAGAGIFAGTTFPDHSSVKAVLDITETALEGLNSAVSVLGKKSVNFGLWSSISTKHFDPSVKVIMSDGFLTAGKGVAFYTRDPAATAGLAASNPLACASDADGNYWRLLSLDGCLYPEQFGALGDPTQTGQINDGGPIQAAYNYAAVTSGVSSVVFSQKCYSVWHTRRIASFWEWSTDGSGMVIPQSLTDKGVTIVGRGRPYTRIRSMNYDGKELATNWQYIAADYNALTAPLGFPWRGHGLYVDAPSTDASAASLTGSISGNTLYVTSAPSAPLLNGVSLSGSSSLGVTPSAVSWSANLLTMTVSAMARIPSAGENVNVSGMLPSTFNGTFSVASATSTSLVLNVPYNPGTWVSGGSLATMVLLGTTISYQLSGSVAGGVGTYLINQSQIVSSMTLGTGAIYNRNNICLEHIWLDGGTTANGNLNWTNPPVDVPDGWDVSHKGICFRPDRFMGDLILKNVRITGYRGELIFSSNNREAGLIIEGLVELGESNGQALNPAGGHTSCPGWIRAWNCNVMLEGWMGIGNIRGEFLNMFRGSTFAGGIIDTTGSGNGFKPQRPVDGRWPGISPIFKLDVKHICHPNYVGTGQTINVGSFIEGKIVAVDNCVAIAANETAGPFRIGVIDVDLEVISVVDRANLQTAISLAGSSVTNSQTVKNVRIKLEIRHTSDAVAKGYYCSDGVSILGSSSFGPNVVVEGGCGNARRGSGQSGTPSAPAAGDYYVNFKGNNFHTPVDYSVASQNVVTTPALILKGGYMGISGGGATNSVTTITLPTLGIQDGYELTLTNTQGPSGYWYFAIDRNATGVTLPARRLVGGGDTMKLRYNAGVNKWQEVKPPNPLSYVSSVGPIAIVTLPALAANAVSALQTISNVWGAEVGMFVELIPTSINSALELVNPQVSAANTVTFRVREVNGGAYAGGNYNVNIIAEHRRTWLA